jgi:5'-phosphate synthase pdxT subunit
MVTVDKPIGVLALQGAFIEHVHILGQLGREAREVRLPADLEGIGGLIIPGGESTTIGKLAVSYGLMEKVRELAAAGIPVWGICAGMVLLARDIGGGDQPTVGLMDIRVSRNAFGRQMESFEANLEVAALRAMGRENGVFHAVFIRAPSVESVGNGVEVLARLEDGTIVAVRQGNLLATAFHPELTSDTRFHEYFLRMMGES